MLTYTWAQQGSSSSLLRRTSKKKAQRGPMINDWRCSQRHHCRPAPARALLIYMEFFFFHFDLAWKDGGRWQLILAAFSWSAASRLNEQSFSCLVPSWIFEPCSCLSLFQCKLEQQACLAGKDLRIMCAGFCPCTSGPITNTDIKHGKFLSLPEGCMLLSLVRIFLKWSSLG